MKQNSKKKLVANSIIYSISGILMRCFSFFLLPLYTIYLTPDDYGINSIATSFISTSSIIVALSLFSAVMRFYVDLKDNPEKLKRFYGTILIFVFLSSTIFAGFMTLLKKPLCQYVFSGIDYYPVIFITLLSIVFGCQQQIYDQILKSQQRAMKSSVLTIATFLATVFFNVTFVVKFRMGAAGTLLATLIVHILYTIFFTVDLIRNHEVHYCLDLALLKEALCYSVPIIPHNLATRIADFISKILIGGKQSLAAAGIYSVAARFGELADTLQWYVDSAYGPWLYERLHDREHGFEETIRSMSRLLSGILGLFFLGISLFAQDYIILLVEKSYAEAWKIVPLTVLVYAIKTMYYFYVEVLFYYKSASKYLFTATLSGSLVNVFLSYLMIPKWGIAGSVFADAIAMVIRVTVIVLISKHFDNIGLKVHDFVLNFIFIAGFITVGLLPSFLRYGNVFSIWNFLYKCIIVVLYILVLFVINRQLLMPLLRMGFQRIKKRFHR